MEIEELIHEEALPVNMKAMGYRLNAILEEGNCNNYRDLNPETKIKYRKCLWLINSFVHGQITKIDMMQEWDELKKKEVTPKIS